MSAIGIAAAFDKGYPCHPANIHGLMSFNSNLASGVETPNAAAAARATSGAFFSMLGIGKFGPIGFEEEYGEGIGLATIFHTG